MGRQIPITVTLHSIIEKSFPAEYAERRAEMKAHEELTSDRPDAPVPLFVMCCMMPGGLRHYQSRQSEELSICSVSVEFQQACTSFLH